MITTAARLWHTSLKHGFDKTLSAQIHGFDKTFSAQIELSLFAKETTLVHSNSA